MPDRRPLRTARSLTLLALLLPFCDARAQVEGGVALAVNSQYHWRGRTTTNRGVVQSDVAVRFPVRGGVLSLGAWASFEGGRYDDSQRHISENGGESAGLAEYDLRVEGARRIGRADVTVGAMTYAFPNARGTTREANTAEAYAMVGFDAPLAPSVALWYDFGKIRGSYGEIAVSHEVASISLGLTAGVNFGQSVGDGGALGFYETPGLTHVELSAEREWTVGALGVTPSAHLSLGRDATTRVTAPGATGGAKFWFGTSLSWTGRAERSARQVAQTEQGTESQPR